MENLLVTALEGQSIGTICAIFMVWYVLNTTGKREERSLQREDKLQKLITKLTDKFNLVEDVKESMEEMKADVRNTNDDVKEIKTILNFKDKEEEK